MENKALMSFSEQELLGLIGCIDYVHDHIGLGLREVELKEKINEALDSLRGLGVEFELTSEVDGL